MKPLELTVYPHSPKHLNTNWLTFYESPDGPLAAGRGGVLPAAKHLTESELSAEFWAAENEAKGLIIDGYYPHPARREAEILLRFAITPHYSEEAA